MGDIVACSPVATYVRRENPNAFIIWGVQDRFRSLVESIPNVDKVVELNCVKELNIISFLPIFERVIQLHLHGKTCVACRSSIKKAGDQKTITISNYYNIGSLLEAFSVGAGLPKLAGQPVLRIPKKSVEKVDSLDLPSEYIVVHCSSNENIRNWDPEKWLILLQKIGRFSQIIEIGSRSILPQSVTLENYISLCGEVGIHESAEVIRRAKVFIGVDSGPAHLANAMRTPGIIIMGKYNSFSDYHPYSGFYRDPKNLKKVSNTVDIKNVEVIDVLAALQVFVEF